MTFEELVQEVTDRGNNYVKTTRKRRFVNRAYLGLCSRRAWPFLETTKEGTSPLTIADLRHVLSVSDLTNENPLDYADRRALAIEDPTFASEGAPEWWFLDGSETLRVYPASTATIRVRYLKKPAELTGTESPLVPDAYHQLIVDWACIYCLKDDDEYQEARELKSDVEQGILEMTHDLIAPNYGTAETVMRTGPVDSYL